MITYNGPVHYQRIKGNFVSSVVFLNDHYNVVIIDVYRSYIIVDIKTENVPIKALESLAGAMLDCAIYSSGGPTG